MAHDPTSVAEVADAAAATWTAVHAALVPVVGARGVAALYKRALFLASEAHPWLAEASAATEPGDFTALRAALAGQDAAGAAAAQEHTLQALHDLLARLIGPSLTGRLLDAVWAPPSAGIAVQDASP